jgi:fumarate hydratase class II
MSQYRTEKDSLGEVRVPADALWGAQTQRAVNNFPISGQPLPAPFIHAVARIKRSAARVNADLGDLSEAKRDAIVHACNSIMTGEQDGQFPVDVFQTGSGTSTNMNVNEVVAQMCARDGVAVNANDDVNMGQSSNDVIPTAIHVSGVEQVSHELMPAVEKLVNALGRRARALNDTVKTGRTHLMDAMPMTLEQELQAWVLQLQQAGEQLEQARTGLLSIPQGGTAVGTGINAHPEFAQRFARTLAEDTDQAFRPLELPFAGQSGVDRPLALSSALRGLAVVIMKIANDLRWMNSGPIHGLAEITLPALQPGSSIMPGKVNPVIPESSAMVATQVMGLDQANTLAAQSGNFQLNVMLPLLANNVLTMTELLTNSCTVIADKAIDDFTVNAEHLADGVGRNPVLVTALNPVIGYEQAAAVAKRAYAEGRAIIDVAEEDTDVSRAELERILDPSKLAHPHRDQD